MESREMFLNTCGAIASAMERHGFRHSRTVQTLRRRSADKELSFNIHLQPEHQTSSDAIRLNPHISIQARQLKKWWKKNHPTVSIGDTVFASSLLDMTPLHGTKTWELTEPSRTACVDEICTLLDHYIVPLAERFSDAQALVRFYAESGFLLNEWLTLDSLVAIPLDFVLCYGDDEQAQQAFSRCMRTIPRTHKGYALWDALPFADPAAITIPPEFLGANAIRLAYMHNLELA